MQLTPTDASMTLRLAVAGQVFEAEIREILFDDGPALVASTPPRALSRAHRLGEQPEILGCPLGYSAFPVMLSEPEKRDANPVRVPWSWELRRMEQAGAAQ